MYYDTRDAVSIAGYKEKLKCVISDYLAGKFDEDIELTEGEKMERQQFLFYLPFISKISFSIPVEERVQYGISNNLEEKKQIAVFFGENKPSFILEVSEKLYEFLHQC